MIHLARILGVLTGKVLDLSPNPNPNPDTNPNPSPM